jgi:ABC-type transport system substrate-binding protein
MIKRIVIVSALILSVSILLGITKAGPSELSAEELFTRACGGSFLDINSPPELIPELRAAAANALAEQVFQTRSENFLLPIDVAANFEAATRGPNPECRALGPILLPQIYVDFVARPDNPLVNPQFGIPGFIGSVLFPPVSASDELTTARARAFALLCRGPLYGGTPSAVIARLESIANGNREFISCAGSSLFFDGSFEAIRIAIGDSLKGAYLSPLGPIVLDHDLEDSEERIDKICQELFERANNTGNSPELQQAAAEAYVQGNSASNLPQEFTFDCVEDLQNLVTHGGIFADAGVDLLAKSLAEGTSSTSNLEELATAGASSQLQQAASLALGIRWASQQTSDGQSGNVILDGLDLIKEITSQTGNPIAGGYSLPIAQAWAGQAMDTAGNCVQAGGITDCILTQSASETSSRLAFNSNVVRSTTLARQLNPETNYKVITDDEIRNAVNLLEDFEGLDLIPLSEAIPGGILTFSATDLFRSGIPIARNFGRDSSWSNLYAHNALLEFNAFSQEVEDALAEYFEVAEDGEHLLLRTRQGVRWSDEQPFTSSDVIFSAQFATYCVPRMDDETGEISLQPFLGAEDLSFLRWSVDGTCAGFPAILNDSSFIAPGPNGQIDSDPSGDDVLYGNRILPSAAPLTLSQAASNILFRDSLETTPSNDDFIIEVHADEIAVIWSQNRAQQLSLPVEGFATGLSFCCLPQHILGGSFDEAITNGDPTIFLERWSINELRETPETFVGTGPYILEEFGHGTTHNVVWRRNPNYWKVDEAGGLLPKLDGLHIIETFLRPVARLQAYLDGQLDIFKPEFPDQIPLQQAMTERGIEFYLSDRPSTFSTRSIALNGTLDQYDPTKEALAVAFRNPEVRRAISQATNRREGAERAGQGTLVRQYVGGRPLERDITSPSCPISFDHLELAEFCDIYQEIEDLVSFDLESANARLDSLGLTSRDEAGIRIIPAGFGHIMPGPNGILDSSPANDDVLISGPLVSGLGFSDRNGDGLLNPDPGIIQPGPNGILDTIPSGDDFADKTSISGLLAYEFIENDIAIVMESDFIPAIEDSIAAGIGLTVSLIPTVERQTRAFASDPPEIESVRVAIGNSNLVFDFSVFSGSCASFHFYRRSDCDQPESREPFQVRIDEIGELAAETQDEQILARLHAEYQLLQVANMPVLFLFGTRSTGSIRSGKTNAPAVPQNVAALFFSDILFRLDRQ